MYIDIAVGLGADKIFTYACPAHLRHKALPGHRVLVQLGRKAVTGFVVGVGGAKKGDFEVRDVIDIPDDIPLIPPELMEIARWVSAYYHSPLGMVLGMMLPPGIEEGRPSKPRTGIEEFRAAFGGSGRLSLNPAQRDAVGNVTDALKKHAFSPFLLHGATGSGKTEVYLRAIEALSGMEDAGGAIVMVPEISLTPQLIGRFQARFGGKVAVMHSQLTDSQRRLEWRRVRDMQATVVVGARSAVFAPFPRLGMVVVDEEHEGSYKQEEGVRYHARDVAVMRAKLASCPVILGSATPSLESYHNSVKKKYFLLSLPDRAGGRPMPSVRIIDLKEYGKSEQLTPPLIGAARAHIEAGRQVLFFLNRRGYSDFLVCADCGHVPSCPNCSISLTYHKKELKLKCHWCGEEQAPPEVCPKCGGGRIKYPGGGTERLQKEVERVFEGVKVTRIDRDTTKGRGSYQTLLGEVASGESQVLLGTQMVAKGHDLPGIGLVGVVMADHGLHIPDFRAAERTFQVVTQAAGRSGRGDAPGEVLIQTYQPEHYSLKFAAMHDYNGFFAEEIKFRREVGYPPFSRLALVIIKGIKDEKAQAGAKAALKFFSGPAKAAGVEVLGPAPAPVKRVRGKYRWFLVLKAPTSSGLHRVIDDGLRRLKEGKALSGCTVEVDVDPQSLV